jgi:hypothetical protein
MDRRRDATAHTKAAQELLDEFDFWLDIVTP